MGRVQAMLITEQSYWTQRSLKDPFQLCRSGILWFLQSVRLPGRIDGAADGQEGEGTGVSPSPTPRLSQESVLVPPPPGPATGPGKTLSPDGKLFFPCYSQAKPNRTKPRDLPRAWRASLLLPRKLLPASRLKAAARLARGALQQLTLTAWPAPPLSARGSRAPLSPPAPGAMPHFPCPAAATAGPGHFPHASQSRLLVLTNHVVR